MCIAFEGDSLISTDSTATLLSSRCSILLDNGDSTIYMLFSFDKACPNFFYEISHVDKKILFTFINTRIKGFTRDDTVKQLKQFSLGPIKTMYLKKEIKDKNETVKGLNPELYYVTNMELICDPIIKSEQSFEIIQDGKTLSIFLKWPSKHKERKEIYLYPKKKRPGLIITLASIGAVGLAGGGYLFYKNVYKKRNNDDAQMLQPVFPEHPVNVGP
jgi:hypothetical protein